MEKPEQEPSSLPQEGDIKEVDGVKFRYEDSGYTISEYYAHLTPGKGPGPGWDTRGGLLDDERSLKKFGQTFTMGQVYGSEPLPDTPHFVWKQVFDDEERA